MLEIWLNQPVWLMVVMLSAFFLAGIVIVQSLSFAPGLRDVAQRFAGVVPPFLGASATLLALLTGFVANDTWDRQRQAERVVQSEADNALAVYDLSIAAAPDMSAIRKALGAYLRSVIDDEWPRMADAGSSARTDQALGALLQQVARPQIAAEAGAPTQAALLTSVLRMRSDRGTRLSLDQSHTDDTKWLTLLILGLLTQAGIGIVHLDRRRAQLAALLLFSTGLVSTLSLIAVHEWPFDGPTAIRPTALVSAAERITP